MKKLQNIFIHLLMGIAIILIQINILGNTRFFGANINLVLIYIAIIAMFKDMKSAVTASIIIGIVMDILFKAPLFKYMAIYLIVSIIINITISKYRKESKLAVVYTVGIATIIFEVEEYIFIALREGVFVNLFSFLWLVIMGICINVIFGIAIGKIYNTLNLEQNKI